MPWFPGKERHLLRSQIARITATTTLAVADWYVEDEDNKGKIKENEDLPTKSAEELREQASWVHCRPLILPNGKTTWLDKDAIVEKYGMIDEETPVGLTEADVEKMDKFIENIEGPARDEEPSSILSTIEEDLKKLKEDDPDATWSAWSMKTHGDEGAYGEGDDARSYLVTSLRSMIWPGAVTVAQGSKFASIYIGYGLKSGALVPTYKNGLPLEGTSPFTSGAVNAAGLAFNTVVPADIMSEPEDLQEQNEPNPQQEEVESEGDDDMDPADP